MFKKCTKNEIMGAIYGVIAVNCNNEGHTLDEGSLTEEIMERGTLFSVMGGEGTTYQGVEAQTATSADGLITYTVREAKEGYSVEFPPYKSYSEKLAIIKDYFNAGLYIVTRDGSQFRIYGIAGDNGELHPFNVSNILNTIPNGRYASGTTLPMNNIQFTIEDEGVSYSLAYVVVDEVEENEVVKMAARGTIISFYSGDRLPVPENQRIAVPTGTRVAGTLESDTELTLTVADGGVSVSGAVGSHTIVQVKPVAGLWSVNSVAIEIPEE